jgi:hypothetical protein
LGSAGSEFHGFFLGHPDQAVTIGRFFWTELGRRTPWFFDRQSECDGHFHRVDHGFAGKALAVGWFGPWLMKDAFGSICLFLRKIASPMMDGGVEEL